MNSAKESKVRYNYSGIINLDDECSKINGLYTLTQAGKIMHLNLNLQERYNSRRHRSEFTDEPNDIESHQLNYRKLNTELTSVNNHNNLGIS